MSTPIREGGERRVTQELQEPPVEVRETAQQGDATAESHVVTEPENQLAESSEMLDIVNDAKQEVDEERKLGRADERLDQQSQQPALAPAQPQSSLNAPKMQALPQHDDKADLWQTGGEKHDVVRDATQETQEDSAASHAEESALHADIPTEDEAR